MFNYCYEGIKNQKVQADVGLHNLYIEGFLLHARILLEFFSDKQEKDTVIISHFLKDINRWNVIKKQIFKYLNDNNKKRLNKYLAHLTYTRLEDDKVWDHDTIYKEITNAWRNFCLLLQEEVKSLFMN